MPFTHHSHSGQFCHHANDTLHDFVKTAIDKGFQTLVMTEHMPRDVTIDTYPEEVELSVTTADLHELFDAYYKEARRLQACYASQIHILVGFETEWIRPSSQSVVENLVKRYRFDTLVGSVHHLHGVPIDFDKVMYASAMTLCGGTEEKTFAHYFDTQFEMLNALKPPIVGHFDLIRRESSSPNADWRTYGLVWEKILRNLKCIAEYHGLIEINTAALRLGMSQPYPRKEICEVFLKLGGEFVLSDDSHAAAQVGTCYSQIPAFLEEVGIESLVVLEKGGATIDNRFPRISTRRVATSILDNHKS